MKAIVLTAVLGVFISMAWATPPTSISLSYDLDKQSLHVEAIHPSFDLEKSYVRLMNVYVNGDQQYTQDYFKQNDHNKFTDDVPVTAKEGDLIKVELFCSLGGDMSQDLKVGKGISTADSDPDEVSSPGG